jgi:hypothetical protein
MSRLFSLGLILPALFVSHLAHAQSANNVYAQVKRSIGIVLVSTFEGQLVGSGSAVTVASQTMVTNRHVLLPGHRYQVYMPGNGIYEAYMTICDSTQDLCLMEVKNLDANPVEFGEAKKLSVGDVTYAVGAPNEIGNMVGVASATKQKNYAPLQLTLSNGLITALRPVEDGHIIQTNAAMSPGSSGGGLFDAQGRLIGITTFMMRSGQSLNMALPVTWVERMGVSGAPRTANSDSPVQVSATTMTGRAPTPISASAPEQQTIEEASPTLSAATAAAPAAEKSLPQQYWWAAIPMLLILFYMMRRRNSSDEDDDAAYVSPAPTANPLLQRFMDEAQQELDQDRPDANLWNMLLADNKGNMATARQSYIERRAARLLSAEKDKQWAAAARQTQVN